MKRAGYYLKPTGHVGFGQRRLTGALDHNASVVGVAIWS